MQRLPLPGTDPLSASPANAAVVLARNHVIEASMLPALLGGQPKTRPNRVSSCDANDGARNSSLRYCCPGHFRQFLMLGCCIQQFSSRQKTPSFPTFRILRRLDTAGEDKPPTSRTPRHLTFLYPDPLPAQPRALALVCTVLLGSTLSFRSDLPAFLVAALFLQHQFDCLSLT